MAATDASDNELVMRLHDRDRDAFGELYRRHQATVVAYLIRRVACEVDAEDLVQETFLRAWANPGDFRPVLGYGVRSWLCGWPGRYFAGTRGTTGIRIWRPATQCANR